MAQPKLAPTGEPANLWLSKTLKIKGREIAQSRYGISLSELVEKLIAKEARAELRRKPV